MKSLNMMLKKATVFGAVLFTALQVSAQSFTTLGSYIVTSGLSNATGRIGVGTNFPGGIFETRGEGTVEQGAWRGFYYANLAEGSRMNWVRGRGTSVAPTSLINGDLIGSFNAYGYTSAAYAEVQNPAVFRFRVDGAVSANVLPTKFEIMTGTSTTARATRFEISSAGIVKLSSLAGAGSRMVTADPNGVLGSAAIPVSSQWVTSGANISYATGNVGIGTVGAPPQKLTVQTASNSQGIAHTDGTITVGTWVSGNYGWLGTYSSHHLAFATGGAYPQMLLANGTGNLGIGTGYTNLPAYRLTVQTPTNSFGAVQTDGTVQVGTYAGTKTYLMGGFGTKTSHPLGFFTKDQSPAIYVDTMSRVGVGTLNPSATLHAYNLNDSIYYVPGSSSGGFFYPGYTTGGVAKVSGNTGTILVDGDEIQSHFGGYIFSGSNNLSMQRRGGSLLVGATYNTENAKLAVLSENNSATTPIATFTANNKTAGVGLWYGGVRAVGTNGNNSLTLEPQAGGYVNIPGNSTLGTNPLLNVYEQDNDYARIQLGNSNAGDYFHIATYISSSNYYGDQTRFYHSAAGDIMAIQGGPSAGTGRVGIGTMAPAYTLDVCGTIRGKEVRVETGWCDYVFDPSFKLRPLDEVKGYIAAHKHLPDVTPASEIEQHGLQVGAVMKQQMLKIEELTLYTIQQDEALKTANAKIAAQEAILQDLAKRLEALEKK